MCHSPTKLPLMKLVEKRVVDGSRVECRRRQKKGKDPSFLLPLSVQK